jgi:hypothetical protein
LQSDPPEEIRDGLINVFTAPPVEGLGTAGGFKVIVEDRGNSGPDALQAVADDVVDAGNRHPGLRGLFTSYRESRGAWNRISRVRPRRWPQPPPPMADPLDARPARLTASEARYGLPDQPGDRDAGARRLAEPGLRLHADASQGHNPTDRLNPCAGDPHRQSGRAGGRSLRPPIAA